LLQTNSTPIEYNPKNGLEGNSTAIIDIKSAPNEIDPTNHIEASINMLSTNHSPTPDPQNDWLHVLKGLLISTDKLDSSVFFNFPPAVPKDENIKFSQLKKHDPADPLVSAGFSSE